MNFQAMPPEGSLFRILAIRVRAGCPRCQGALPRARKDALFENTRPGCGHWPLGRRKDMRTCADGVVEPLVYTLAALTVIFIALLAALPAARRAASVDPMVAMRSE